MCLLHPVFILLQFQVSTSTRDVHDYDKRSRTALHRTSAYEHLLLNVIPQSITSTRKPRLFKYYLNRHAPIRACYSLE